MQNAEPQSMMKRSGSKLGFWLVLGGITVLAALFVIGRNTDFLDIEALQLAIAQFADGPWGVPALILTFCACAFIGVPQFLLIGVAVYAFGPMWGAVWSWLATLCSGSVTFWVGRFFGQATLQQLGEGRLKRFADFVARNAFAASAIVRNVPTGPFLMVNMIFGGDPFEFLPLSRRYGDWRDPENRARRVRASSHPGGASRKFGPGIGCRRRRACGLFGRLFLCPTSAPARR